MDAAHMVKFHSAATLFPRERCAMGIPDPFGYNEYGDKSTPMSPSPGSRTDVYDSHTGAYIRTDTGTWGVSDVVATRNNHTKNPVYSLSEAGPLWRNPSSYERSVGKNTNLSAGQYTDYVSDTGVMRNSTQCDTFYVDRDIAYRNGPSNPYFNGTSHRTNDFGNDVNRASTECLLKLKDQKVNLAENLATAAQTAETFAGLANGFVKSLVAVKRGRWGELPEILGLSRNIGKASKSLSSKYLEYIYGVKPLCQDIYSTWQVLTDQLKPAMLVTARRTVRSTYSNDWTGESSFHFVESYRRTAKCQLTAKLSHEYWHDVAAAGLINPLSLAWELQPYSFVVDWAFPVGNVLSALDATTGLTFVGGFNLAHAQGTFEATQELESYNRYGTRREVSAFPRSQYQRFSVVRTGLNAFPLPFPYWKSPFSTQHGLNALALLRNFF